MPPNGCFVFIVSGLKLGSFHTRIFLGNLDDASERESTCFISKYSTLGGNWKSNAVP